VNLFGIQIVSLVVGLHGILSGSALELHLHSRGLLRGCHRANRSHRAHLGNWHGLFGFLFLSLNPVLRSSRSQEGLRITWFKRFPSYFDCSLYRFFLLLDEVPYCLAKPNCWHWQPICLQPICHINHKSFQYYRINHISFQYYHINHVYHFTN